MSHLIQLDSDDVEGLFQALDLLASVVARLDPIDGLKAASYVHSITQHLGAKHDLREVQS